MIVDIVLPPLSGCCTNRTARVYYSYRRRCRIGFGCAVERMEATIMVWL